MNLRRVRWTEWLASLGGLIILVGLFTPWQGDDPALAEIGVLDLVLFVVALVALFLPLTVAFSRTTNVPIVVETFVSTMAVIATLILLVKLIWAPDEGLKAGFYLGLAGSALLALLGWKSTARET